MAKKRCPHCGASMVEYKRNFNEDLSQCVRRLAQAGGDRIEVSKLRLTHPQYSNFQRIRFWGLAYKEQNEDGTGKGGVWSMTSHGWDFVRNKIPIYQYVSTYRGEAIAYSGSRLFITDMTDGWWYKPKVIAESRAH